jgi:acyl-CoA oxidase
MPTLGIGQPALDLATAFPQATPASIFPPSVSDYYQLDDLLSPEDVALRKRVRDVMETHIAPVMAKVSLLS